MTALGTRVLIDSSVWVETLAVRNSSAARHVLALIDGSVAATTGTVRAEILPFVAKSQERQVNDLFDAIPRYEIDPSARSWDLVTTYRYRLRRAGLDALGMADLMITAVALEHGLQVWSFDKHFALIAKHLPLARYVSEP